jgi:hypothetical protein
MMPSADHETVLPNTTKIPVKNNIEQSPLTRAIGSPFRCWSVLFIAYSCFFSHRKSIIDPHQARGHYSPSD